MVCQTAMVCPKLAADERKATRPFRFPYPTGNNGIAKFYQFLVSDVSFFCMGLWSRVPILLYARFTSCLYDSLSHLFFSLKNHTSHFFVIFPFSFLLYFSFSPESPKRHSLNVFIRAFLVCLIPTSLLLFLISHWARRFSY